MGDISSIRLLAALGEMASKKNAPDTLTFGTVVSVSPLEIDIGHNITLTEEFLFLGQMCRPHKVTIPHYHIVDTRFTEISPSIGSVGAGMAAGAVFEQNQSAAAQSKKEKYTTLVDNGREDSSESGSVGDWKSGTGEEKNNEISMSELGRGSVSTSIAVAGAGSIADDGHKHIIARHETKDVHFPVDGNETKDCVTIEIYPRLKEGDKVLMFAFNEGQMYYVAERVEVDE